MKKEKGKTRPVLNSFHDCRKEPLQVPENLNKIKETI
jgi:hypothetical protein